MGTVTIRVPEELKEKMKKYGIEAGEVARRAWDAEVKQRELDEAREAADSLGEYFSQFPKEKILEWIHADREKR